MGIVKLKNNIEQFAKQKYTNDLYDGYVYIDIQTLDNFVFLKCRCVDF